MKIINKNFLKTKICSLIILSFLFVIVFLFYSGIVVSGQILSGSMENNLKKGDKLLFFKTNNIKRKDIVIFKEKNINIVKRIIGLSNEIVDFRTDGVYVNNKKIEEPYLKNRDLFYTRKTEIGPDEVFVCGDNRKISFDSRDYGPIKKENVSGKAFFVFWPLNRIHILK